MSHEADITAKPRTKWEHAKAPVAFFGSVALMGGLFYGAHAVGERRTAHLTEEPALVLAHHTYASHKTLADSVPITIEKEYDLTVEQHEPGKVGADQEGNAIFVIPVSKSEYDAHENGSYVTPTPKEIFYATPFEQ